MVAHLRGIGLAESEEVMNLLRREIHRLPGMRDVDAQVFERLNRSAEIVRSFLGEEGYAVIDTPLLEETDLFVRKSGGELSSRLYSFTDPGGRKVSLRPEFTSSVIRHLIEERASLSIPIRWQYSGPVFRYESGEQGGYRQFTQMGAELVGASGVEADLEIIRLAWDGLVKIGLSEQRLRVGHLGLLRDVVDAYGLSEPAKLFVIGAVQDLKSGQIEATSLVERATEVGLLRSALDSDDGAVLGDMGRAATQEFIQGILRDSLPTPIGRRTTEQIMERLQRRVSSTDSPARFADAVSMVQRLSQLNGSAQTVLNDARRTVSDLGLKTDCMDELGRLLDGLTESHVDEDSVSVDFGLARGIAYYTGIIFELVHSTPSGEASLGGGGRYDGLVQALGGDEDLAALGFAYNLDQVVDSLGRVESSRLAAPAGS